MKKVLLCIGVLIALSLTYSTPSLAQGHHIISTVDNPAIPDCVVGRIIPDCETVAIFATDPTGFSDNQPCIPAGNRAAVRKALGIT